MSETETTKRPVAKKKTPIAKDVHVLIYSEQSKAMALLRSFFNANAAKDRDRMAASYEELEKLLLSGLGL